MDAAVIAPATAALCGYGARLCFLWVRARTAVQLAEIDEEALSTQLRSLPPGSSISKRRHGQSETVVRIGGYSGHEDGHRG